MDAVYGMEGHGPSGGTPRYVGVILASFDSVALDAASSAIIGYDPLDIDIIEVAKRRGLGEADLSKISILGSALDDVKVKDFKLAQDAYHILRYLPRILHRPLKYLTKKFIDLYPKIDRERCIRCQVCVNACPPHVISSRDDLITIDYADCIRCYCCHELCPEKAISIERSFLAKRWRIGEGVRYG
jgi:ferredoxin